MKFATLQAALGSALLLTPAGAEMHGHRLAHSLYAKRHSHSHGHAREAEAQAVEKRSTCALPNDPDIVQIGGQLNGGWALPPDRPCATGMYCPYACVPGKVMNQWKPNTAYVYPESQDGGLLCDSSGTAQKPFPDRPYCVPGTGTVSAVNLCGKPIAHCMTVLPGSESMLIPTTVTGTTVLAVNGPNYWAGTANHYYVNPPGVPASQACTWGTDGSDSGNWSPYVTGANTVADNSTYVKLGWNPMFTGSSLLAGKKPTFGMRIECVDGTCNGLPCEIDPSQPGFNVHSNNRATGAGGADFCVVTVPPGGHANIVFFNTDGSSGGSSSSSSPSSQQPPSSSPPSAYRVSSSTSSSSYSSPTNFGELFHENGTRSSSSSSAGPSGTLTSPPAGGATAASPGGPATTSAQNAAANPDMGGAAVIGLVIAVVASLWLY